MTAVPAGLILSLIGVIRDKTKWPSIVGLAVSGLLGAMITGRLLTAVLQSR